MEVAMSGFEQQLSDTISVGTQYVYRTTKDLVGWEAQGGDVALIRETELAAGLPDQR